MAGFFLVSDPTDTAPTERVTIVSQAYTIGDLVMLSRTAADVIPATAATITANVYGVAAETVTSAATSLLVILVNPRQKWGNLANATANTAHNFQRMILTDKATVNNTGTDVAGTTGIFMQTGTLPNLGTKYLVGKILAGYAAT